MRNVHIFQLIVCLGTFVSLATTARAQTRADAIVTQSDTRVRGTVVSTTRDTVNVDGREGKQTLAANEIQRIVFAGEPSALRQAREALADNQYANALESLRKIELADIDRDIVRQEVEFYLAFCRTKQGDAPATAVKEMQNFVKQYPSSYHFYDAVELLGDLAMHFGSYENAVKYYGKLAEAPWSDMKLKSAVLEAGALQAQGPDKYPAALKRYDAVIGSKSSAPGADRQRQLALAGKASCEVELGNTDQALTIVKEIIEANDPDDIELFARAYNALGACYRKTNKPKDAVLAYLHVDLLFQRSRSGHAEALYYLSDLWNQIGKPDRAVEARNRLKTHYAETTWASR